MNEEDPRLGKASASRLEIVALCPGSEQLRRNLPPEVRDGDVVDEYASTGRRIHYARQTRQTHHLAPEELEIYERGCATEKKILDGWISDLQIAKYEEGEPELRLYLNDPNTMAPIASGQMDVHYLGMVADPVSGHTYRSALVIDWKSLWSPYLTPAERNWQGKLQAVTASIEFDAPHVRMVFNKAMFGVFDQVDYNREGLAYALQSILLALWESEQAGAQLRSGPWCRYCPCKAYCPEALAYAQLPTVTTSVDPVRALPVDDLVPIWRKRGIVDKIFKQIAARLKALPTEELNRIGLRLAPGRKNDKLKDVKGAFAKLLQEGWTEDEVFRVMNIGKTGAIELLMNKTGQTEAQASAWWEQAMAEFTEPGKTEPSLTEL